MIVSIFVILIAFTSISMIHVQAYDMEYTGLVTGESGDPIAHAKVEFLEYGVVKKSTYTNTAEEGNVGWYSLDYTTERFGIYSIRVSKPDYHTQSKGVIGIPNPRFELPIGVDFQLELIDDPVTTFAGCVREEITFQYIVGATVYLKLEGTVVETTTTLSNGNYYFYDIVGVLGTSIEYKIVITHPDYTTISKFVYTNSHSDGWNWELFYMNDEPAEPMRYGLIIGINDYELGDNDGPFYDLQGAVNDANSWNSWFDTGVGFDYLIKLTNSQATKSNILDSIAQLNNIAEYGDTFALIFSGHGANDEDNYDTYICTYECDPNDNTFQDGYLEDLVLADALEDSKFGKIFIFLDSCHSGGFVRGFSSSNFNFAGEFLMLMACPADLTTSEYSFYGTPRGPWSYFFLNFAWLGEYEGEIDANLVQVFSYATIYELPVINKTYQELMGYTGDDNALRTPPQVSSFTI